MKNSLAPTDVASREDMAPWQELLKAAEDYIGWQQQLGVCVGGHGRYDRLHKAILAINKPNSKEAGEEVAAKAREAGS